MLDFGFYNMDCLDGMKEFPDGYFDLAICDPPYGDGGGHFLRQDGSRFGGRFDRYKDSESGGYTGQVAHGRVNTAKKSLRGILPRLRNISMNCFVSHATK